MNSLNSWTLYDRIPRYQANKAEDQSNATGRGESHSESQYRVGEQQGKRRRPNGRLLQSILRILRESGRNSTGRQGKVLILQQNLLCVRWRGRLPMKYDEELKAEKTKAALRHVRYLMPEVNDVSCALPSLQGPHRCQ